MRLFNKNRYLIFLIIIIVIGIQFSWTSAHSEEQHVILAVEQFFKALEMRDAKLARDILMPEGVVYSVRDEGGEKVIRATTHQQIIDSFGSSSEKMLERMWDPKVLIHKEIAVLWTKYDFHRDGKFSHCGVDAFNLIKTPDGWKISGIFYTVEKEGCEESPSGPKGYWVPVDPPKCHYVIDAKIDPEKGLIEGKETVIFKNNTNRPIDVLAFNWRISGSYSIDIFAPENTLTLLNKMENSTADSPLFYRLSEPLGSGNEILLEIFFKQTFDVKKEQIKFGTVHWYPRIWWDGLPVHDSFSVKLHIPEEWAMAISGRLNEQSGRHEIDVARTFGIHLAKDHKTETRVIDGILVTTLFTDKGAMAASVCMDTAVDAIKHYKDWLGFYPFESLYIIPGGPGRWGGYPFATGIVVIHGEETFKEGESLTHWKRITAHEIGHEYWGEWVLDPDNPAWVWIGMGIFADTEYILSRNVDPHRRQNWMSNYLNGTAMYYDTTVDIPPAQLSKIQYDHNNTVIHSKGFSIVSALDSVLGRDTFERIYKKCLKVYGGKRLGWRDLQRFFEKESGQNLDWFFDQWVRSNRYLCYKIESQKSEKNGNFYRSEVKVKRLGSMMMPVPVKAVFEDGTEQVQNTDRRLEVDVLVFRSDAKLKEATLDPDHKMAMLKEPLVEISEEAAELLGFGGILENCFEAYRALREESITNSNLWYRLGMGLYEFEHYTEAFYCFEKVSALAIEEDTKFASLGWLGLLKDLMGDREEALTHYQEALKHDTGKPMRHGSLRITMDQQWIEERLKTPFTTETLVEIPSHPTAEQLQDIVDDLNWKREGRTPFLIYEKAKDLTIDTGNFWLKLGMLLFDSGYYQEGFAAMEKVSRMEISELYKFTAFTWMGHLKDLMGEREEAVKYYKLALEHDEGDTMHHSQFRMRINKSWVEKRLKTPFNWKKR
jgi:tetratricopeptide (TPR) repeat protein